MNKQNILDYLKSNKERYSNQFGVKFIGLFGSFARDEADEKSDIDILYEIEENKKLSMFQYLKLIGELENNFHTKIDLVRTATLKPQIKNYIYQDLVYVCSGTDSEKLEWFKTINIAGEKITDQELRNAVYSGSWVSDAKRYFSKSNCPAYAIGSDYLNGSPIRQDYLETAIKWINKNSIEEYMAKHQHDPNASALWRYFQDVISWIKATFPKKRKFMKGVDWGILYNQFKDKVYDTKKLEEEIARLILDDDVTNKKGIYPYILTRKEKYLSIRTFSEAIKQKVYEKQERICTNCKEHFELSQMEADHITPWHEGGKTIEENCQMLCKECNRRKSGK